MLCSLPNGLEDVSTYPALFAELIRRNYTELDLKKLAGMNLVRVFRANEQKAQELQATEPPFEDHVFELDSTYNKDNFVPECRTDF